MLPWNVSVCIASLDCYTTNVVMIWMKRCYNTTQKWNEERKAKQKTKHLYAQTPTRNCICIEFKCFYYVCKWNVSFFCMHNKDEWINKKIQFEYEVLDLRMLCIDLWCEIHFDIYIIFFHFFHLCVYIVTCWTNLWLMFGSNKLFIQATEWK